MKTIKTIIICLLACFTMSSLFACVENTPVGKIATAIAMKTTPKTEYYIGDAFDVTGGSITVTYSDATVEDKDLTLEMVTVPALTAEGELTVTVTYSGLTTTYQITVSKTDAMLLAEAKTEATTAIEEAFATYTEEDYLASKWAILEGYYTDAKNAIELAETLNEVTVAKQTAINGMAEVLTQEAQLANFNAMVNGAIEKINNYDERSYKPEDLATYKSKIQAHTEVLQAIQFTGDDEADATAVETALNTAVADLETVKYSYTYVDNGKWVDSTGASLTETTENLPEGFDSAYVLNYDGTAANFTAIFKPTNGIDTTDIVNGMGGGSKPTVVFTFWLYVEDASKLIGTNGAPESYYEKNGAGLNVYMGTQEVDSSVGRGFYLDGKWYKTAIIGGLVSGWNKISLGAGSGDAINAPNIVFTFYKGADADLNVKMMLANLRVEYLDEAQNGRALLTDRIADLSSIAVKTAPTNLNIDLNATSYAPENGVVTATYADGETEEFAMTAEMVTLPDTTTKGYSEVTISYTVRGITKTTTFEVSIGITLEDVKAEALTALNNAFNAYNEEDYLAGTWATLEGYYTEAKTAIENATEAVVAKGAKEAAIVSMATLKKASDYNAMFESLKETANLKLVLPARQYTTENLAAANTVLTTAKGELEALVATGNETTDTQAIEAIIATALENLSKIASWLDYNEGSWVDGKGNALTEVTENLPEGFDSAYVLNYDGTSANFTTIFKPTNGIDTTDLVNGMATGGKDKPSVVFTFWFYVEDASKLIGTNGAPESYYEKNGAGLNVYMGTKEIDSSVDRGFYLDGKWYKTSIAGGLVSGWNKISIGTGSGSGMIAPNIVFTLYNGADTNLNVKMMIANLKVEYLATAQTARAKIVEKIGNLESIAVSTLPANTMLNLGVTEYAPEGGKVTVTYAGGNTKVVDLTAIMCNVDLTVSGERTVTVTYTERGITKTTTFTINIVNVEEAKLVALTELEEAYEAINSASYNATKWAQIVKFYEDGQTAINAATTMEEVNEAKATAIKGMKSVLVSYVELAGTYTNKKGGTALNTVTENIPAMLQGKTVYELGVNGNNRSVSIALNNTLDTTRLYNANTIKDDKSNYVSSSRNAVVTFWLYIEDVTKLGGTDYKSTASSNANIPSLIMYMTDNGAYSTSGNRAFGYSSQWTQNSLYPNLVNGWNKVYFGQISAASSWYGQPIANYVDMYFSAPKTPAEGMDLANVKLYIADLKVEYLETPVSMYIGVSEKMGSLSSIEVTTMPSNVILPEGTTEFVPEGGKVTLTYADGKTEVVDLTAEMCKVDLASGEKTVTVSYTVLGITKTTTFDITLTGLPEAKNLSLTELGELFENCIQANYNNTKWASIVKFYNDGVDAINNATTMEEVNEAKATAVNGINGVSESYVYINGYTAKGRAYTKSGSATASANVQQVTEDIPSYVSGNVYQVTGNAASDASSFFGIELSFGDNLLDIEDLMVNNGGASKPTVVFTFWLYVSDASKVIGTNNAVANVYNGNGTGINVCMSGGNDPTTSTAGVRAFYLDGKWYKTSFAPKIVTGWNKISVTSGAYTCYDVKTIGIHFYQGTDTDLANVTFKVGDFRIEYLDTAQNGKIVVSETHYAGTGFEAGTWTSNGTIALTAVTEGLPTELAGQTAYVLGMSGETAEARFTSANTINTTAIKEGAVTAPYEATLTFWFYVEDASKLVGTTGEKGGAAKLEVYIGNSTKLWEERALFLDGNHFKAQLCYGQLVSGWNKISVSTSYSESLITSGKSLRIIITNGTGTDNTVKMMVANPQIEVLETAQTSRAKVVATIPNATENA